MRSGLNVFVTVALLAVSAPLRGAGTTAFEGSILPLLNKYCNGCHSTAKQKGDLDLERFSSVAEIKKHPLIWEGVLEQLANNEMPPKKEPQLPPAQKQQLIAWVQGRLDEVALASAGDPGPVVLRRLSNMEYTYTLRDLTGVASLDPAREFPVDGAAGEGFTNAGAALVMSPALLTKYLDAAKETASHAVLLPEGIRFSASTSSRDWTEETLAEIRAFYGQFSESGGAMAVNLQGVKFDTNAGGRLPVERYLAVLLKERDALRAGRTMAEVAKANALNVKYLTLLWQALQDTKPSILLDAVRARFHKASAGQAGEVAGMIHEWQQALWRFASVGHIGKKNGPTGWQEPVNPLVSRHEMRMKLAAPADGSDVTLYLSTLDAGDGPANDLALWDNARLVAPGRPDLALRDVRAAVEQMAARKKEAVASAVKCLAAAHEADAITTERTNVLKLAAKNGVVPDLLTGWLDCLGIGSAGSVKLGPLLTKKMESTPDYRFIKGWTGEQALSVLANSSDQAVRIPGTMKPHSVATHPSPTLASVIAWRSPVAGVFQVEGNVQDVHPECGNGVTWALELRRGHRREVLSSGLSKGGTLVEMNGRKDLRLLAGDVIAVVIGPREGNHTCDLTAVNLLLSDGSKQWSLAGDVSPNILAGNPHADSHGNAGVWHFFGEPATAQAAPQIPAGSLLARWRASSDQAERGLIAEKVQQLLQGDRNSLEAAPPDAQLRTQLLSFNGPLLGAALRALKPDGAGAESSMYGLDKAMFGRHPKGAVLAPTSLCVQAPSVIEVRLPASLADGAELVVTGRLDPASAGEGSVQMQVLTAPPAKGSGIAAGKAESALAGGLWSDNNLRTVNSAPVIAQEGSAVRSRFESAFDDFRSLFPAALCYTKIVPVDEVVTLTLFYREDDALKRLMLDDRQAAELDRLWAELRFVSESPLKQVDVFEQLYQFATQDASPSAFEPMREPIMKGAAEFKRLQKSVEPQHVQAVLDLAERAWRRPVTAQEQSELHALYQKLRTQDLPHAAAVRMLITRVLVAPAFLYRGERATPGLKPAPVNDWELATRLSYLMWASTPDEELRTLAAAGKLRDPDVLVSQAFRLAKDSKIRRLATEFGCQWLHVRDVETLDEKSERHFPTFASLRADMQEEAVRFFMDLFQSNGSVLCLLDADHSFVNGPLAKHYGLGSTPNGWQRVDGLRAQGRGGMLAFASTLAKQSGASRTSPILRGNWLSEVVLGDRLPRPPKGVPILPEEAPQGLTERQLIERHSSDAKCAGCHQRIDPFGFALEGFDAIGRARSKDAAGLSIDTRVKLPDGTCFEGLEGLRAYLMTTRRDDFLRQFCRKLLGYALGRSVQLSDKPLIESMLAALKAGDHRVMMAVELVVRSPQFREVRGRDYIASH